MSSYTAHYITFHFLFAYAGISSRPWKVKYGIDHQVSPRGDTVKYGPKAVQDGKLTQAQLNQIIRVEGAHANSVEHFPLFVGAMIWAHVAGVPIATINNTAVAYTIARLVYAASYIFITDAKFALLRGVAWWTSNVICLRILWLGGKKVNQNLVRPGDRIWI